MLSGEPKVISILIIYINSKIFYFLKAQVEMERSRDKAKKCVVSNSRLWGILDY